MRNRTHRRAESIDRASEFDKRYPDVAKVPAIAKLFAQLHECNARIWDGRTTAVGARVSRGTSAEIQRLKDELRHAHRRLLARLGRKVMGSAPGAERAFHAPGTRARADIVVASSRAMLKVIGRRQALFKGLVAPDFFRLMKSRTDELDRQWRARDAGRTHYSRAVDDQERATSEGRALIDLLNTYLVAHFRDDRLIMTDWRQTVRVRKKLGRPKRKAGRATPPPAAA